MLIKKRKLLSLNYTEKALLYRFVFIMLNFEEGLASSARLLVLPYVPPHTQDAQVFCFSALSDQKSNV